MKKISTIALTFLLCILLINNKSAQAQNVIIPDANFKAALVGNPSINTNGDSEIQVSEAAAYRGTVNVGGLHIADLTGVEAFVNIPRLYCNNNDLTSIDVSKNTALTALRCNHNQLTTLDVSKNALLTDLRCYMNSIDVLDLSDNSELSLLMAFNNHMTSLGISENLKLARLDAGYNDFTTLDLRPNSKLTQIDLRGSKLTTLNVKNGQNTNITSFTTLTSIDLLCITVDDPAYSEANWTNVDNETIFRTDCEVLENDIVYIPDPNFKKAVVDHDYINVNGDDEIQRYEAERWFGSLFLANKNISDMTGVEAFINIGELHVQINNIATMDVSHNTKLRELFCDKNHLTALDVSNLPDLGRLQCFRNPLSSLDLSHNPKLVELWAYENNLATLDLSHNPALTWIEVDNNHMTSLVLGAQPKLRQLIVDNNDLTSLDVSGAPEVMEIEAQANKLTSIDLSNNLKLYRLRVGDNRLTSLDVTNNVNLEWFECYNNQIASLDLSHNPQLYTVHAYLNKFTSVNVKSGNNRRIVYFNTTRNPGLNCIQVDDPHYSEMTWTLVDAQTEFSYDCSNTPRDPNIVFIPDPKMKAHLVNNPSINTNGDGEIQVTEARATTGELNFFQVGVLDPTGIQVFTRVSGINFQENRLAWLDVRGIHALVGLDCSENELRELHITPTLESLHAGINRLTAIDYNGNYKLRTLSLYNNGFTSFEGTDYGFQSTMVLLDLRQNPLTSLDVSTLSKLSFFSTERASITEMDLSHNPELTRVWAFNNLWLTFINVKNGHNTSMIDFQANNFRLQCVEVDDVAYVQANPSRWRKTSSARWSTDCDGSGEPAALTASAMSIGPNPTSGRLSIESTEPVEGVQIYDGITGGLVAIAEGHELDITGVPSGIYLVKVNRGGVVTTTRIVKR